MKSLQKILLSVLSLTLLAGLADEEFIAKVIDELRPFDVAGLINCQEEGRERRARIVYSAKDQFMYAVPSCAHVKKSQPLFDFWPR